MTQLLTSSRVRSTLLTIVLVVIFLGISELTGFGDWVNTHPIAAPAIRVVAILIMGGIGLALLVWGSWRERLLSLLAFGLALLHITILLGDPLGLQPQ